MTLMTTNGVRSDTDRLTHHLDYVVLGAQPCCVGVGSAGRTAAFCSSFLFFFSAWAAASLRAPQIQSQSREVRMQQHERGWIAPLIPLLRGEATRVLFLSAPRLLQVLRLALLTRQAAGHRATDRLPTI